MRPILCSVVALAIGVQPHAARAAEELKNWFNDPYFQVRSARANCPVPRGPFMTQAQRLAESHHRAERGTSCWLAKQCEQPNAYLYDADIATAVAARFALLNGLRDASLWVTVQGRMVFVSGCVAPGTADAQLERLLAGIPHVDQVIVNVARTPGEEVRYRTMPP